MRRFLALSRSTNDCIVVFAHSYYSLLLKDMVLPVQTCFQLQCWSQAT